MADAQRISAPGIRGKSTNTKKQSLMTLDISSVFLPCAKRTLMIGLFLSNRDTTNHAITGASQRGATSSPADLRRRCAAPPCRRQPRSVGRRFPVPAKNSLFGQTEFPVFGGTGNPLQAIESVWRPAPKTAQRDRNGAEFSKDSLLISLFSGKSVLTMGLTVREQRSPLLPPERRAGIRRQPPEVPHPDESDEPDGPEREVEVRRSHLRVARMRQRTGAQHDGAAGDAQRVSHLLEHAEQRVGAAHAGLVDIAEADRIDGGKLHRSREPAQEKHRHDDGRRSG